MPTILRRLAREAVIFTLLGPFALVVGYCTVQAFKAPRPAAYTTAKACDSWFAANAPKQAEPAGQRFTWDSDKAQPMTVPCVEIQTLKNQSTTPPWFLYHSPTISELSKDKGFLAASQTDQTAYLKTVDPAFAKYSASEQQTYLKWIVRTVADPKFNAKDLYKDAVVWDAKFDSSTGLPYFDASDAFYIQAYDGTWLKFAPGTPNARVVRTLNKTPLLDYVHPIDAALVALVFGWPLGLGAWFAYRVVRFAIEG